MRTWVQVPRTCVKARQDVMCLWPQWWAGKDKNNPPAHWLVSLSNQQSPVSRTNERACLKHKVGEQWKRHLVETSELHTCVYTCALRPTHINIHTQRGTLYITGLSHSGQDHFLLLSCNCRIQIISISRTFASLGAAFQISFRSQPTYIEMDSIKSSSSHKGTLIYIMHLLQCWLLYIRLPLPEPETQLSGHHIFNPRMTFSVTFPFF